jgi:hypothetical protein
VLSWPIPHIHAYIDSMCDFEEKIKTSSSSVGDKSHQYMPQNWPHNSVVLTVCIQESFILGLAKWRHGFLLFENLQISEKKRMKILLCL